MGIDNGGRFRLVRGGRRRAGSEAPHAPPPRRRGDPPGGISMKKRSPIVRAGLAMAAVLAALAVLVPAVAGAAKTSNKALVAAHGKALAECSAEGLVNGYTANATLFFPDGV